MHPSSIFLIAIIFLSVAGLLSTAWLPKDETDAKLAVRWKQLHNDRERQVKELLELVKLIEKQRDDNLVGWNGTINDLKSMQTMVRKHYPDAR